MAKTGRFCRAIHGNNGPKSVIFAVDDRKRSMYLVLIDGDIDIVQVLTRGYGLRSHQRCALIIAVNGR